MRLRTIGGVVALGALAMTVTLRASDIVGIYTVVEKVVLEPAEAAPLDLPGEEGGKHGHTDGDAIVWFVQSNVVHTGDLFVTTGFPLLDLLGGGSSAGLIAGLEKAIAMLPADVKVIPGHGEVSTLDDLRKYVAMVKATRAAVQAGVRARKSLAQLQADKVLEPWQLPAANPAGTSRYTESLYNELTGKVGGKVAPHH